MSDWMRGWLSTPKKWEMSDELRFWLIRKLAGKRMVVLNASFVGKVMVKPRHRAPAIVVDNTFDGVDPEKEDGE